MWSFCSFILWGLWHNSRGTLIWAFSQFLFINAENVALLSFPVNISYSVHLTCNWGNEPGDDGGVAPMWITKSSYTTNRIHVQTDKNKKETCYESVLLAWNLLWLLAFMFIVEIAVYYIVYGKEKEADSEICSL